MKMAAKKWASAFLVAAAFAAATYALWGWANRPDTEAPWPKRVQGMAFSPFRADQDGRLIEHPSSAQVDEDLQLLAGRVYALRTYGTSGSLGDVPRPAAKYGITVAFVAWPDQNPSPDKAQP